MGSFSWIHWLIVGLVILLLFGKGRFSEMMGNVAKGLKSFKKGMTDDDDAPAPAPPRRIAEDRPVEARPAERAADPAPAPAPAPEANRP